MSHRAGKSGIGYEIEKKMEANYDREEEAGTPGHVIAWIEAVMGADIEKFPGSKWNDIQAHLKTGVILCQLINKLMEHQGKPAIKFAKKNVSTFVELENIQKFAKQCEAYGIKRESTLQSGDLNEGKKSGMYNCLNALHSLGFQANSYNYMPAYTGQIVKTLDNE